MEIIEFLRDKLGIIGKVSSKGWYQACCPIHKEKSASFGVFTSYPFHFNCFSCDASGQLPMLVAKVKGWPLPKAVEYVQEHIKVTIDVNKLFPSDSAKNYSVPEVFVRSYKSSLPGSETMKYCLRRGVPKYVLESYQIGHDVLEHQMMIPLRDITDSRFLGFEARGFFPGEEPEKRALIPAGYKGHSVCAPVHYRKARVVVVTEGFFDSAAVLHWFIREGRGEHTAISFGGAGLSNDQIKFLTRYDKIILALDNDEAGKKCVSRIAAKIQQMPLYQLKFSGGKDPGEADPESFAIKLLV